MDIRDNCGTCGCSLIYDADPVPMNCTYCGTRHDARIYCPEGHYVCDACHKDQAMGIARKFLRTSTSGDPLTLFEGIVTHPAVSMHGPEHHAIAAGVIVAAARNTGYPIPFKAVAAALDRGEKVPGGWCGFYGACGAGIAVGVAVSVLTRATPLTGETRSLALRATSAALSAIADGDPRCCKRAGRKAIEIAVPYLSEHLGIQLDTHDDIICRYTERNKECPGDPCPYFSDEQQALDRSSDGPA